jgi:hypothetical protein
MLPEKNKRIFLNTSYCISIKQRPRFPVQACPDLYVGIRHNTPAQILTVFSPAIGCRGWAVAFQFGIYKAKGVSIIEHFK